MIFLEASSLNRWANPQGLMVATFSFYWDAKSLVSFDPFYEKM